MMHPVCNRAGGLFLRVRRETAQWLAKLLWIRGRSLTASFPLLAANLVEALVTLIRNIALAHMIAPREFGLAISVSAIIGIVDVLADFGVPVYAVRKTIDQPEAQVMATVQCIALIRATIIAAILFVVAPAVAREFGVTSGKDAYLLLSLVAFARGFENFGVKAMTRDFRFGPEATVVALAQVSGFAVTIAVAAHTRSFACILWGMATSTAVTLILSHALSPTRYRLGWNARAAKDIAAFGFPLLANGAAVAFCLSDRILIGAVLSPSSLALYNVTVGTAQSPRVIAVRFLTSAFVPAFVRRQHAIEEKRALHTSWTWLLSGLAFAYAFCLTLCGRDLIGLIFGRAYAPSREFMALTAMYIFVSFLMSLPVPLSYANGRTKMITFGSGLYALGMLPALLVLLATESLPCFMLTLSVSEFVSLVILIKIYLRDQPSLRVSFVNAVFVPFGLLSMLAAIAHVSPSGGEAKWLLACGSALAAALVVYLANIFGPQPTLGGRAAIFSR